MLVVCVCVAGLCYRRLKIIPRVGEIPKLCFFFKTVLRKTLVIAQFSLDCMLVVEHRSVEYEDFEFVSCTSSHFSLCFTLETDKIFPSITYKFKKYTM